MKGSTLIAVAAGLTASLVSAQLDQIPQCALTCAFSSIGSTGCQQTDIGCICRSSAFIAALTPCVRTSCSAAEFEQTIQAATVLCSAASVTLSIPSETAATSATVAPSSVVSSVQSSVSSVISSIQSSATSVISEATSSTAVTAPTGGNSTATTGPPTPSATDSAANRNTIALGGLGALFALVAALL